MLLQSIILGVLVAVTTGNQVRQLLERMLPPTLTPFNCAHGFFHEKINGTGYYYSWVDLPEIVLDWTNADTFCRQWCMDLVSLDTMKENEIIKQRITDDGVQSVWTSGHYCPPGMKCTHANMSQSPAERWYWSAKKILPPTTDRNNTDWSQGGSSGNPQPDSRDNREGGFAENCLAIVNDAENSAHWHDVGCHYRMKWICEENAERLQGILKQFGLTTSG